MSFNDQSRMLDIRVTKIPWDGRWLVIKKIIPILFRGIPVMIVTPTSVSMTAFSDAVEPMIAMIEEGFAQAGASRQIEKSFIRKNGKKMAKVDKDDEERFNRG